MSGVRSVVEDITCVFVSDGRMVVETAGMSEQLPSQIFPPNHRIEYHKSGKRIFRVLSRQIPDYRLQIALEVTFERNMLAEYREGLWTVLGIGLMISAMIGYAIARKGIRPVQEIAATVRRIRSSTLNERVGTAGLPSELSLLASTFNEMLDHLEDAFARLARFSSDIAHEFVTPINNVRAAVAVAIG